MAAVIAINRNRRPRVFKNRVNLGDLVDTDIVSRYRISRDGILTLVDQLTPQLERQTRRTCAIPVLTQVLVGLRYLAKGDFLSEVADLHGISRSSACIIIDSFVCAVNDVLDNIRFPDGRGIMMMKQGFYRKCNIPNIIGAIDCTLIPIVAPADNEETYVCRKNYHAINVQAVVDHQTRFIDAVVRWPGSTHDASIFDNSGLKVHLEENDTIGHLLGDSGYPLRRYLLTPMSHLTTAEERSFNFAHSSGRMVVERAFGLLKSRFRCLHKTGGCLAMKPDKCCRIIMACMKLHNLCYELGEPAPEEVVDDDEAADDENFIQDAGAQAYRRHIVNHFMPRQQN